MAVRKYYAYCDNRNWYYGAASFYRLKDKVDAYIAERPGPAYATTRARYNTLVETCTKLSWRKKLPRYWALYKNYVGTDTRGFLKEYPIRNKKEFKASEYRALISVGKYDSRA